MPKSKKKRIKKNNSFGIRKEKERKRLHEIRQAENYRRRDQERESYILDGGNSIVKEIVEILKVGGLMK